MIDFDQVVQWYRDRLTARGTLINYMAEAQKHFDGEMIVPLPEMQADEKPAVANLMLQGLDQTAMRAASVMPHLHYPPMVPGKDKNEGSEDWAHRRRLANLGWWEQSRMNLKLRRIARWTIGYGTAPMMVRPNFDKQIPEYVLRDPLSTFPAIDVEYDDEQPSDFIFAYTRTFGWLSDHHPDAARSLARHHRGTPKRGMPVELLEYVDNEVRILGVLSSRPSESEAGLWTPSSFRPGHTVTGGGYEIARGENRAGVCWGVTGDRITVSKLQGQFQQVFGIYQNQAELMALETIAVKKAIFPDLVLQGTTPGRTPILVNGTWADGRSGEINLVRDGSVQAIQLNPGFMTQPLIDRHERNIRQAGVPSQFSGETPTGIATGRLGDQILSATVDFPIQEYQEIMANLLKEANVRAIAIAKSYFGDEKKSFYVSFGGNTGQADYRPNTHFETDAHLVNYSAPGADVNSLVIGIGQRIGIGTMSKQTAMRQDPMVIDAELEYRRALSENIEQALLEYVQQAVVGGALDPLDVMLLREEIEKGESLATAWTKANEAAQKRQAEAQQAALEAQQAQGEQAGMGGPPIPGGPAVAPGPGAQPGLSPPGDPVASIQGPSPSQQNLSMLLGALRQPRPTTAPLGGNNTPNVPVG